MKKKIFVMIAVVAAVMAIGISSALAFGGPPSQNAQTYRDVTPDTSGDGYGSTVCDGSCDGVPALPQDGTGSQFGQPGSICDDEKCIAETPGYGDGTGIASEPQDGTGNQYGARDNRTQWNTAAPRDGSTRQCGRIR